MTDKHDMDVVLSALEEAMADHNSDIPDEVHEKHCPPYMARIRRRRAALTTARAIRERMAELEYAYQNAVWNAMSIIAEQALAAEDLVADPGKRDTMIDCIVSIRHFAQQEYKKRQPFPAPPATEKPL